MHCQVSEMLIHLGSPVKSEKHTALISVDTLKSVSGWLLLFLRFTCYYEEYMAHSDSWQRQACLRRVKRCEQVLLRCWHWLGSEYIWGWMFFFSFLSPSLCCPARYSHNIWFQSTQFRARQVTQIHAHLLEVRLLWFWALVVLVIIKSQVVEIAEWTAPKHEPTKFA